MFATFIYAFTFAGSRDVCAQQTFKIEKASRKYDLVVKMDSCDKESSSDQCIGPGHISLFKKGEESSFQTINQDNIVFDKVQTTYNPDLNTKPRVMYDDEYSLIFGDFNFDGEEDLAICNGRNGVYGAPSYTIYLFEKRTKTFIMNPKLSSLTEEVYLGLFFPDPKKKQIRAYWKSGCCFHAEEIYRVLNDKPVLVEKSEQEVSASGFAVTTTRKRINGKWIKTVKKSKVKIEH